jgi:hypothetical protein
MQSTALKAAALLSSAVASVFVMIGSVAAADMPANPPAPPPNGYYGPPAEEGYVAPPAPPPVYAYPPAPVYRYYAPPVAVVPAPYYVRPYYGWGYARPFYGPYARGYGRYHGYWR